MRRPATARTPAATAALLLVALAACGEESHYAVNLAGEARRVDADGNPLPGEELPDAGAVQGPLRGTLQLDPALGVDPERFACVFLIAGRIGSPTSDAVDKVEHPHFPLEFALGGDTTHGSGLKAGEYRIQAWLDSDGDAQRRAGDVIGQSSGSARPGGQPIVFVLDRVLTEADLPVAPETAPATAPAAPFAAAAGGGATAPTPEDLAGPRFRGTVELPPEFAELNGKHRLSIIVRSVATAGAPLLVKPVDNARFPLEFDFGTENAPVKTDDIAQVVSGQVKLYARLSLSGGATGAAGDIESEPLITSADQGPFVLRLSQKRTQ